ncbi:hypothetical protein [Tunicatimonas pelagia]|uniref:hypothetical protein n=1 Tax=Tunicatimonas pelagia TaxID=931531 RepID=UPI002666778E|nr:hypothetical protein [Tunicatimonas pelagia]WKN45341.1 hypothetical protein P0M28_10255 [Tunicatimonas pelagia]
MKDKRLVYILLPAVAVIWIVIGYRIYQAVKGEEPLMPSRTAPLLTTEEMVIDTYTLQLNYADPFLKRQPVRSQGEPASASSTPILIANTTKSDVSAGVNWGRITYLGMIENSHTQQKVAIIALDGVRKLVKIQDRISPFLVEKIYKDSVLVRSGKDIQYIVKEGRIKWLTGNP